MTAEVRSYRFADSQRPGLLLGLSARQAVPVIAGVLALAASLQIAASSRGRAARPDRWGDGGVRALARCAPVGNADPRHTALASAPDR